VEPVRIALAQINPTVGDLEGNVDRIAARIDEARTAGADIIATPELCLSGYPPEDLLLRPHFLSDCHDALESLIPATGGICCIVGWPETDAGQIYNSAAVLSDRKLIGIYRKMCLPNYGVFDEKRYFSPGTEGLLLSCGGLRIALHICEDSWHEGDGACTFAAEAKPDAIINISGSPYHAGKTGTRREVFGRLLERTGGVFVFCNLVGGQDEIVFDGGSFVLGADGSVAASAPQFAETLLLYDLPGKARAKAKRRGKSVTLLDPRPKAEQPQVPPEIADPLFHEAEVFSALVLGTHDYVRKNGFERVVIGISGGIDSALTAAVAVKALGAENVVGVTMPSRYSSEGTKSDAARLCESLGIGCRCIPIEGIFEAFLRELAEHFRGRQPDVAEENIQARVRGTLLMALSNKFGWMVLTTGNKSETATGYCTLYGDMAGGFAVLKDVPKTLVYSIAEWLNKERGREVIPSSIIARAPSAELAEDQKDQDSLPPYPVLDQVLQLYVEQDLSHDDILARGFPPDVVERVLHLVDANEYKRRQAPPGVKITPKAFGRDRRPPITNSYRPYRKR